MIAPQTKHARLVVSAGLLFYAVVCLFIAIQSQAVLFGVGGVIFLSAAIGAPFQKGIFAVVAAVSIMLAIVALLLIWTWMFFRFDPAAVTGKQGLIPVDILTCHLSLLR